MNDEECLDAVRTVLPRFECELIRRSEESFARLLTGRNTLRFRFGNDSYTDGRNVTVDPSMGNAYSYTPGIVVAEKAIDAYPGEYSANPLNTLHAITRALNIHECLHIMFTRFPLIPSDEPRLSVHNGGKILQIIQNIIEDYYIEEAGCTLFDNMRPYLLFLRTAVAEAERHSGEDTKLPKIMMLINRFIKHILYPMSPLDPPPKWMTPYLRSTAPLFNRGCTSNDPDVRYRCACAIFDLISDLIPEKDLTEQQISCGTDGLLDPGTTEQNNYASAPKDPADCPVPKPPLNRDGIPEVKPVENRDDSEIIFEGCEEAKNLIAKDESMRRDVVNRYKGEDFPGPHSHDGIDIVETDFGTSQLYVKMYEQRRKMLLLQINSLDKQFKGLFAAEKNDTETKLILGSQINSRKLWDVKKRYWMRNPVSEDVPSMGIMLLIDGSGSMCDNREKTIDACICIHEVLEKSMIRHEIAEHRAYVGSSIEINVLKNVDDRGSCGSNLMRLETDGCNRDGLAILWAESRIRKRFRDCDVRMLILVSDGLPHHETNRSTYSGESARKDVCGIKERMRREGIPIIAIALDEDGDLTEKLKEMYDHVLCCTDVRRLPRKLFEVMTAVINKMF